MKLAVRSLTLLAILGSAFAHAQNSAIQHIIVLVQENRTPDNLFQDQNLRNAGADIVPISTGGKCGAVSVPLIPRLLNDCVNPNHNHNVGWLPSYDNGHMDGACTESYGTTCTGLPLCPTGSGHQYCPQYAYVDSVTSTTVQPYFQIAEKYGFANYFFQTSQGPSFPAHQFLLSGTSAPDAWGIPWYTFFAAENMGNGNEQDAGCAASSGQTVQLASPTQDESTLVYPCFEHKTLTDLLDQNQPKITWRYYSDQAKPIWTAPNAIAHICNAGATGCGSGTGSNQDWNNVILERTLHHDSLAPFLQDLQSCNLAQVTWVVPDGRWSDHPSKNIGLGPDYVADIVNAIGQGMPNSTCNPPGSPIYWNNTVILIVWDDWGGWYDHVNPIATIGQGNPGYPNSGNNNGIQYVYGFRVPLLVVSTYLKQTSQQYTGYISGTKDIPINYDFGSIIRFIEETFLSSNTTFINPIYPYADQFVDPRTPKADLSDFFDCFTPACRKPFQPVTLVSNPLCTQNQCQSNQCDATCFIKYKGSPVDPDDE
jgi:Phosphoesterase family